MHSHGAFDWRGKGKRSHSDGAGLVLPDDEVVAVAVGREVAVDDLRARSMSPALASASCARSIGRMRSLNSSSVSTDAVGGLLGPELPLVAEQRGLVEVGGDVVEGDALDRPSSPRKGGTNTGLSVSTSGERSVRGSPSPPSPAAGLVVRRAGTFDSLGHPAPVGVVGLAVAALELAQAVHDVQALEGVLAVEQPALVDLAQVALDVGAGQGGAAEQHRDVGQAAARSAPRGSRA